MSGILDLKIRQIDLITSNFDSWTICALLVIFANQIVIGVYTYILLINCHINCVPHPVCFYLIGNHLALSIMSNSGTKKTSLAS